jgi:hypothetical protein
LPFVIFHLSFHSVPLPQGQPRSNGQMTNGKWKMEMENQSAF